MTDQEIVKVVAEKVMGWTHVPYSELDIDSYLYGCDWRKKDSELLNNFNKNWNPFVAANDDVMVRKFILENWNEQQKKKFCDEILNIRFGRWKPHGMKQQIMYDLRPLYEEAGDYTLAAYAVIEREDDER